MPTVNVTMAAEIGSTFKVSASHAVTVDAYDVIKVAVPVPANAGETTTVQVQPGTEAGQVAFLMISADVYDAGLSYTAGVQGGAHALDAPHVLVGAGSVGFLGTSPPTALVFTNATGKVVSVSIVVGRKAIPPNVA